MGCFYSEACIILCLLTSFLKEATSQKGPLQLNKFLLMTDELQQNTFQIDVDTGEVRAINSTDFVYVTAMDFDPICKCLYCFDISNKLIRKTALYNSYKQTVFNASGMEIISMAVDVSTSTLNFIDDISSTIRQLSLNSRQQPKVLLDEGGSKPRALVLDKYNRRIYWSDCSRGTIERGSITNPTISRSSVVSDLSSCVTAFVIDFQRQVIYFGEDNGVIESANLDGTLRTTIYQDQSANYRGLALDNKYLYIADSNKRQIQKLDRNTNQITNLTKILFTSPYALVYYPSDSTPTTEPKSTAQIMTESIASTFATLVVVIVIILICVGESRRRRVFVEV